MYILCVLIIIALVLLVLNRIFIPPITKEGFVSYGYPWHYSSGWAPGWWSSWWNRPWFQRPIYPQPNYPRPSCPAGCVYSGYGSNIQSGFRCLDPGANCPVGSPWCCKYDRDCNAC